MGITLIDKSADYSQNAVGFIGLHTEVSAGLVGLHDLRFTRARAISNAVAPNDIKAQIIGNPVISAQGLEVRKNISMDFGLPTPNGSRTFAILLKQGASGIDDHTLSNWKYGNTTTGGDILISLPSRFSFIAFTHTTSSPPFTDKTNKVDYNYTPADYSFIVVTMEDGVGITIYDKTVGISKFQAVSAGDVFSVDNPMGYKLGSRILTETFNKSVLMFALWDRALTENEVDTFYEDMQSQLENDSIVF